jgi:hypothetical protein
LTGTLPGVLWTQLDLATTPQQVVIAFNQNDVNRINNFLNNSFGVPSGQGFSFVVNLLDGASDIELDAVTGGTTTEIFGPDNPPPSELVSSVQVIGTPETLLTIPFADGLTSTGLLPPGSYQLSITGGTTLDQLMSLFEQGTSWSTLAGEDPSQTFVVGPRFTFPGVGATYLQAAPVTLGASGQAQVSGTVEPDNWSQAVQLYRFTLGAQPLWQVGIEVAGQSNQGTAFLPALTLFDVQNGQLNVLATSTAGLPSNPSQPYLFKGLGPGTYYVGVSGYGNLPTQGGYNPVTGLPGTPSYVQHGVFQFQLNISAVPHPQYTYLNRFSVDRLDPLGPSPTGLTLSFSAPIDLRNLFLADQVQHALELVDSSGQSWPITAENYDVTSATLHLVIDEPLPPGEYSLIVTPQGGLSDLAGLPVVAPGEPSGVLAFWTVPQSTGPSLPNNLGVLWPVGPLTTDSSSFSVQTALAPGQAVTYQFASIVPGLDKLQTQVANGQVAVYLLGPGGTTVLDLHDASKLNNYLMFVTDGLYQLRFVNVGSQPASLFWVFKIASVDWEKIIDNGVGQTSALSLALFSGAQPAPDASLSSSSPAPGGALTAASSPGASGPVPFGLLVSGITGPLGQPLSDALVVAPVGPVVDSASVALADGGKGLMPGIRYTSTLSNSPETSDPPVPAVLAVSQDRAAEELVRAAASTMLVRLDAEVASARADERALVGSEWLARLGNMVHDWLVPSHPSIGEAPAELPSTGEPATRHEGTPSRPHDTGAGARPDRNASIGRAEIGIPTGVIMAAAFAYRLRQSLPKWWRRRRGSACGHCADRSFFPAPHGSTCIRVRATTKLHKASVPR